MKGRTESLKAGHKTGTRVLLVAALALTQLGVPARSQQPPAPAVVSRLSEFDKFLRAKQKCSNSLPCLEQDTSTALTPAASASLSVANGASFDSRVSPGGWIAITGTNLAGVTRTWQSADFNGDVMPIALSGTSVKVGDKDAAIYYVSPTQINALIPPDAPFGQTTVVVTSPVQGKISTNVNLDAYAPGLFMFDAENRRYVAAVLPDGTLAAKAALFGSSGPLTRPVKAGQPVALYATGLGATNPAIPPGRVFSDPREMYGVEYLQVTIGGRPATIGFVGAVSPGLYQINVIAPALASGDYAVVVNFGSDARSQPGAMITIQGDPTLSHLQVAPTQVNMTTYPNSATPASQQLQLLSTGEDFNFSLQSSVPWLTFDVSSGRTPATVRIQADGRSLKVGTYSATISVLAPGTATPGMTVPVTITVSDTPQITISRSSLSYQLVTNYHSLSALINVTSEAGNVDFTVTKTGDSWLSVPQSGTTPAALRVTLYSETRTPGTLNGGLRITPAGGGTARDIAITLTIVAEAPANGPPQIVALSEDEVLWGRGGTPTSFTIYGQNLDGATTVNVNPPLGITVSSVKNSSSSVVTMDLSVAAGAAEGVRTITLTTARGVSNSLNFMVRRGQPQIRTLSPPAVTPGRYYSTAGFVGSPGPLEFKISGIDLEGITDFVIDPPDNLDALWSITTNTPVEVWGVMIVDGNARIGQRRFSIATAGGTSNVLPLTVEPVPAAAPVIANLKVNSTSLSSRPNAVNYSGQLDFSDVDGDITSGAKIYLMAYSGSGSDWRWLVIDDGSYLEQKGKTAGTITFQFQKTFAFLYNERRGTFPVLCMIQDKAGNLSNVLQATVSTWDVPVL